LQFDSKPQFWQYLFGICKKETRKRQQWQKLTINHWHTSNKQPAVKKQQATTMKSNYLPARERNNPRKKHQQQCSSAVRWQHCKSGGSSKGTMKNPLTNQPEGVRWWAPIPHCQSYSGSVAAGIWQKINKTF